MQVLDMEGSGLRMTRSARQLRTLARERLCLAAQFRGEGTLEHMGITGVTAPGQLNLVDATSESGYLWTGLATRRIFFVDYAVLGLPVDLVRAAVGRLPASPFYQASARH